MHTESIHTGVRWVAPVGQNPQLHHRIEILYRVLRIGKVKISYSVYKQINASKTFYCEDIVKIENLLLMQRFG